MRDQLSGVSSLLPIRGRRGLNSGHKACIIQCQLPLPNWVVSLTAFFKFWDRLSVYNVDYSRYLNKTYLFIIILSKRKCGMGGHMNTHAGWRTAHRADVSPLFLWILQTELRSASMVGILTAVPSCPRPCNLFAPEYWHYRHTSPDTQQHLAPTILNVQMH